MPDLSSYRSEFPVVEERTYLISASLGPLSNRARTAALEHLDLWGRLGPEELWFDHGLPKLARCRELFARLIGADPDETAVVPSVSAGLSQISTCLDFSRRPKVVVTDMDFPTNHYVWRAAERVGAKVDVVRSPDGIGVPAEDVIARIDEQTAIVNLNRVMFESSWIMDAPAIVEAAHEHGALVVVDDFHGSGIVPIDVHELGCDLLLTGALKWLCGGQGIAFLYCRRDLIREMEPLVVGWFGTKDFFGFDRAALRLRDDARRFETGTLTLPQAWTAAAALELVLEVGVENIRSRNRELTEGIVARADAAGIEVASPRDVERRGGLVRLALPGGPGRTKEILHALFERDVVLDSRGSAVRVSPHFFNDEHDLDRCFRELSELL
ncbi:MAG TPA: aminotransferase class V-fold PLP-dependent enzyme [Actinomycetota bacterium]|nr:aminotransferase class V-fold PLP-dependent enzyme [Actinomycetota bacterium]